ncbi:MAG: phosphatase PAP2 family protein [Nitrospirae bacterium]|nr:phosphatase PAP2 family protein [Nitrospirota bacterium]
MTRRYCIRPVDALSIAFVLLLSVLTAVFHARFPEPGVLLLRFAGAVLLVMASSLARQYWPGNHILRYANVLLPIFVVLFSFDSMGKMTGYINPPDKDPLLARLDLILFGVHPGEWMGLFVTPVLTTILQLCYTSYYFLPVILCLMLYFNGEEDRFDRAVFGIVFGFFVSYVGYILVPALGPRYFIPDAFTHDLMRGPLASAIDGTLNMLEGENRDAFPSGHTEIVLIILYYAWRYRRWYFWVCLPLITGLIIATVYLRYHYAVDVLAGTVLAPVCVLAGDRIYDRLTCRTTTNGAPGASRPT